MSADSPGPAQAPVAAIAPKGLALWLAALVSLTPFAIDSYLPAIPAMAAAFGTSVAHIQQSVSSYLLGFALGQLLGGPLSDRYGRRLIGTTGLLAFITATVCILLVDRADTLVLLRFLQAAGGGFATVISAAIVRDLFHGREAARIFSIITSMMLLAPLAAPVIGSLLLVPFGWKSIFVFLLAYAALMLVLVRVLLPETVSSYKRAKRQRQPAGQLLGNYRTVIRNRRAMGFLLTQSLVSGTLFVYITTAPFVFMEFFSANAATFPIYFGMCVLGLALTIQLNIRLLRYFEPGRILVAGVILHLLGTVLLLLVALTGVREILVWMVPLVIAIGAIGITGPNCSACYLEFFPNISGSANALYGATLFIAGAMLGALANSLHTGKLVPIAALMALCASAALFSALVLARAHRPIAPE